MSPPATFHCPECGGLLEVAQVIAGAPAIGSNGSARSGRRKGGAVPHPAKGSADRPRPQDLTQKANERAAQGRVARQCPVHHRASTSRFGGLYCPAPDPQAKNGWCSWTPSNEQAA